MSVRSGARANILDIGGIDDDQRIGFLDRSRQGERQGSAVHQGHLGQFPERRLERLQDVDPNAFVGQQGVAYSKYQRFHGVEFNSSFSQ